MCKSCVTYLLTYLTNEVNGVRDKSNFDAILHLSIQRIGETEETKFV